jgi:hypothetical protein
MTIPESWYDPRLLNDAFLAEHGLNQFDFNGAP